MRHRTFHTFKTIVPVVSAMIAIFLFIYRLLETASLVDWTAEKQGLLSKVWNYVISGEGTIFTSGGLAILVLVTVLVDRQHERTSARWQENRARVLQRKLQRHSPPLLPLPESASKALETPAPKAKPILECVDAEALRFRLMPANRIEIKDEGLNMVAVAYFRSKAISDTDAWVNVRAVVTLHNLDSDKPERGKDAVWL